MIALQIALPTLLEELKTRGANASQQNAGQFGRALTQAPILTTLVWGAVLGALGEELFFRGLLWTTLTESHEAPLACARRPCARRRRRARRRPRERP